MRLVPTQQVKKVSWELEGTDAHLFTMTSDGVLSFNALPDYENPLDNDGDNKYVGTIKVITTEDGSIFSEEGTLSVTDVDETDDLGDGSFRILL